MLREVKFRLVQAIGRLTHRWLRVRDLRRDPLRGQVELRPARTVHWDLSKLTYIGPEPFWWTQEEFSLDLSYRVELPYAEMIGKGVVIMRDGTVILESTLFQRSYLRRSHVEHLILGRKLLKAEVFERVVPLTNFLDRSYFHWTMESMGRLALAEDVLANEEWKVLVDERSPRFIRETMSFLMGIDPSRIIESSAKRKVMRHCLMVSNPHSRLLDKGGVEVYPPEHIRWLNRRGHERIGGTRKDRTNYIISRHKQPGRHIMNEDLLVHRYPQLAFKLIALEDLSLHEQVDLFAHAGVIVGVHGAGLANLVYAQDAAVIEFYPARLQEKNAAYFVQIAACLGLPHLLMHYAGEGEAPDWNITLGAPEFENIDRFLRDHGII